MRVAIITMRSDGVTIIERPGLPDITEETTTAADASRLVRDVCGPGCDLVSRPSGARGVIRAEAIRVRRVA